MKQLICEQELTLKWKTPEIKVSICCITYNHEEFIEDALIGFLMQKTDFAFEILIHDDASNDNTVNIIKRYAEKFPSVIKPIFQKENQYSKGLKINPNFNFNRALGSYIALCEGDDYWVDDYKLMRQVEVMEENKKYDISFHPCYQVDGFEINPKKIYSNYGDHLKFYTVDDVIMGGGDFMPTASLMIRSNKIKKLPDWFLRDVPVGDMYLQILSSLNSGAIYIPKVQSIYRVNIKGSWSTSQKKISESLILTNAYKNEKYLLLLNKSTNYCYQKSIHFAISREFTYASLIALKQGYYVTFKKLISKSNSYKVFNNVRFIVSIFKYTPHLLRFILKVKGVIL